MSWNSREISFVLSVFIAVFVVYTTAECPNACSSHGKCGAFDACQCYRNWMANDCSERICQFGLAHVDTPKGDLDGSGGVLHSPDALRSNAISPGSNIAAPVVVGDEMYPDGTYELFPNVMDTFHTIVPNSAHEYRECSNKGICDRASGSCTCFEGYDGSACQRASCPTSSNGVCSGHGLCSTIKEIARFDYNNTYDLWDEFSSMGCICDAGFSGPDCSQRQCKHGADPLFFDDESNIRYSNFTFVIYSIDKVNPAIDKYMANGQSARTNAWKGNYSIVFYDAHGKDWHTTAIDIAADCDDIKKIVEELPNKVIKSGSVRCSMDWATFGTYLPDTYSNAINTTSASSLMKSAVGIPDGFPIPPPSAFASTASGIVSGVYYPFVATKFTLAFPSNPGKLRQPAIDIMLDGSRRTLSSMQLAPPATDVRTWVYPNGFSGEDFDFVPNLCEGVKVTLKPTPGRSTWGQFDGLTADETILLKECLGDSDGDLTNNNLNKVKSTQDALYNWDYGITQPTMLRPTDFIYDPTKLLNPHLVKIVDTSIASETRLCDTSSHFFTGADQILSPGYCSNGPAPGFYLVLYYDPKDMAFKFLSRPWQDYSLTTTFNVFTTTGFLKLASQTAEAFTTPFVRLNATNTGSAAAEISSWYSNVLYTQQAVSGTGDFNVDCESNPGALQCIEKGDYIMILDTAEETGGWKSQNPKYHNIYQVMKISRENRETTAAPNFVDPSNPGSLTIQENTRYQIVLDMSLNARFLKDSTPTRSNARIYKFNLPKIPVNYVGECSYRGVCDTVTGLCSCFPGYTSDDCSVMNALAV